MSDTPIFDQLAAERGYDWMMRTFKQLAQSSVPAMPFRRLTTVPGVAGGSSSIQGARPCGMYINEWNGGQTDEDVNAAPTVMEDDEEVVFIKPIPVTTLADLAKGQHQE